MQQLFPREGETQPRLRFPEFQSAGEWARMSIQEMIDKQFIIGHLDGNHGELYPKAEEFSQTKEGIPYITANDFINGTVEFSRCKRLPLERARLFKKGVAKDGDILFAHNATVGPVAKLNTDEEFVILSTTATYFRCNAKHLSNDFLKSALSSPDFVAQYSRVMSQSTRNQVPITTQRKLELRVPKPDEQQRIADCLSSLDALIAAQAQKHEALKTHKKGLMQQLFPSPEEVAA
jgi:type I restriction enzyme S subunit